MAKTQNPNLSVNHYICGEEVSFPDFATAVRKAGMTSVGITRTAIAEMGIRDLISCLKDQGLGVSSLNSAGYFTLGDPNPIQYTNKEMVEFAAQLNADVLCVITGGLGEPPLQLDCAHRQVEEGFGKLAEFAAAANIVLGLEPIYPADILTKGCINSCAHGLDIVALYGNAKLILDLYHSWWDPDLSKVLHDRSDKVALLQLCNPRFENGLAVGRDTLSAGGLGRHELHQLFTTLNYHGTLELELFNHDLNGRDPLSIIRQFPNELERCRT
ncbi:MAG: TIM barrel protein [Alphaproteobacteria bacterium]|nr:TIM barrel protein [Alphaproteobacteria bacterium]